MATTTPDNIWTPDSGDDYALTTDLAAMADTIQDALNTKADSTQSGIYYTRNNAYTWATENTRVIWDNVVLTSPDFTYNDGFFTCVNAGVYGIQSGTTVGGNPAAGQINMSIRNTGGSALSDAFGARGTAHIQSLNAATLRPFAAGDVFSVTVISTGSSTVSSGGGQANYVMVWRVR